VITTRASTVGRPAAWRASSKNDAVTGRRFDALLLVSFGGPEGPDDVLPFLARVTAGRGIPAERLVDVAEHYLLFGGTSPINGQNRALLAALRGRLDLPIYWGNRNSAPLLVDALGQMRDDGVQRALAFVTSAYGSYSGCRQYRDDIARAQDEIGEGAPRVEKLRAFYNHPMFVGPFAAAVRDALERLPPEERHRGHVIFTAHSVPMSMARTSPYVPQLLETARLVAAAAGVASWSLAWQSRSGPPHIPWLEPDVEDELEKVATQGISAVIIAPIGFVSDHMEVVYDLDTVAVPAGRARGLAVERAATPGLAQAALAEALIGERNADQPRTFVGTRGPAHDGCPVGCCPAPARR
jgi:ferrochelatase